MYTPENQYRCTIIRGKSQTEMEDYLPLYANMVHKFCPCKEDVFKESCNNTLAKAFYQISSFELLSRSQKKTIRNHLTEVAGILMGLYYPTYDENGNTYINESDTCRYLVEHNDYPTFFKNLCLNFQFPNGAKKWNMISEDMSNHIHIKPFCYVVALLYYAQRQKEKNMFTKQEIGYYVLNNLDVLQGRVSPQTVYEQIMQDRKDGIKREKLSGSRDWQHINEQFNLLALSNVVESDAKYIWLNPNEAHAIEIFINHLEEFVFDAYSYPLTTKKQRNLFIADWKYKYGLFNEELLVLKTNFHIEIADVSELFRQSGATKSTVDIGDEGEALVFRIEQERVRKYRERLVNKVLLLGKTKGLGYDISSIEADENPQKPEFARYIEVKATKRITEPSFDSAWSDSINITSKEWVAAEQYKEYYNIYRVYFTKKKTIIVRIKNPYQRFVDNEIEVYPTIYQVNFDASVIEKRYAK